MAACGNFPATVTTKSKEQVQPRGSAQDCEFLKLVHGANLLRAAQCKPGAEHKQELPAERVEVPVPIRKRRQIPVELTGCEVETNRRRDRDIRPADHAEQDEREDCHQYDEQLQHIEIQRLGPKQQAVNQRPDRVIDNSRDVEFADKRGRGGLARDISDQIYVDHEQDNIGGVKLPQPLEDSGCRHDEAALQHHPSIEDRGRITADEHEQVGGAAEPEIAHGQQADRIVRDVVQKKKPGRDTKQETESEIAVARGELGLH